MERKLATRCWLNRSCSACERLSQCIVLMVVGVVILLTFEKRDASHGVGKAPVYVFNLPIVQ